MNHSILELRPFDVLPCFEKNKPKRWCYYHFNVSEQAFYEADVVVFRDETEAAPVILKNRYGTPVK